MQDAVRFTNGRCYVGDNVSLEAPLEAFGQCKLVSSFGELHRTQVLDVARLLGLEVLDNMPYDELRWTSSSMLQRAWFEQIPGGIPKGVQQNYEERMAHYQSVLAKVKRGEYMSDEKTTEVVKKVRAPKSRAPESLVTYTYSLSANELSERVSKGVANEQTTNHDFIIVKILQGEKSYANLEHLTKQVENTGRYTTNDPLPKSIKWHLNKMEKEGVVIMHAHSVEAKPVETKPVAVKPTKTSAGPVQATAKA